MLILRCPRCDLERTVNVLECPNCGMTTRETVDEVRKEFVFTALAITFVAVIVVGLFLGTF